MHGPAAIGALFVGAIVFGAPQPQSAPVLLKSSAHAVQLDAIVTDAAGQPVHGLHKEDFVLKDNGQARDIRIFSGELDVEGEAPASRPGPPPGMYSNRLGLRDWSMTTAIVIDAVPRPQGLQKNEGEVGGERSDFWWNMVRTLTRHAIARIQPGQAVAIYAACPELEVVQDFTTDPDRLLAGLNAFAPPALPKVKGKKPPQTIEEFVPPMLAALRETAARLSRTSGRKSIVWVSQAYGTELKPTTIARETGATIDAFSDANIPLYAVDSRFTATCGDPTEVSNSADFRPDRPTRTETLTCSQSPDVSDKWMHYLAEATGGRAFSAGKITGMRVRTVSSVTGAVMGGTGFTRLEMDNGGAVSEALRFASDDSRSAYEIGFYIPEPELDGKVHTLLVSLPGHRGVQLRYRNGYRASSSESTPPLQRDLPADKAEEPRPPNPETVGIDARVEPTPGKNERRVSFAVSVETVGKSEDGAVVLDVTFTQTDMLGKQVSKVQDTLRAAGDKAMAPFDRVLKMAGGAVLLHITVYDRATNRVGTISLPIR
jgi:VWFA-related protein